MHLGSIEDTNNEDFWEGGDAIEDIEQSSSNYADDYKMGDVIQELITSQQSYSE